MERASRIARHSVVNDRGILLENWMTRLEKNREYPANVIKTEPSVKKLVKNHGDLCVNIKIYILFSNRYVLYLCSTYVLDIARSFFKYAS